MICRKDNAKFRQIEILHYFCDLYRFITSVKQEQDNHTAKDSGYNGILKYIGIFGGVQGFVSVITLLKVAIVSHLLGPNGVGLTEVYNRTVDLGKKVTDLGISYSAVQTISERRSESEGNRTMGYAIKVVRSWSLWLAMFGTLLFFLLAPLLSRWSFDGDCTYTPVFRLLSLIVGCSVLMSGELAVLKGARILGRVAWYQLLSAVVMLAVSIPCYYILGFRGIIPSLLLTAIGLLVVACWHSFKEFPYRVDLFSRKVIIDGFYIISQGVNYTLAGFLNSGAFYLVSVYIFNQGSEGEAGCYSYGSLLISYLSMLVFAALDNEFFPRLSAVNKHRQRANHIVNNQIEMLMVLITPLIVSFAVCLPLLMKLFDAKFMPLVIMTQLGVVGQFFKTMMHPPACLSLSKGESRIFLLQEVLSYIFMAVVMIGGFKYYGLKGLGVAILLTNLFDWLSVWFITKIRYKFSYSQRVWQLLVAQCPILIAMLIVCLFTHGWLYVCGSLAVVTWSAIYSSRFLYHNTTFIHQLLAKIQSKNQLKKEQKRE